MCLTEEARKRVSDPLKLGWFELCDLRAGNLPLMSWKNQKPLTSKPLNPVIKESKTFPWEPGFPSNKVTTNVGKEPLALLERM